MSMAGLEKVMAPTECDAMRGEAETWIEVIRESGRGERLRWRREEMADVLNAKEKMDNLDLDLFGNLDGLGPSQWSIALALHDM
jgi:TPR repeat protein